MSKITPNLVLSHGREVVGAAPTDQRANALAEALSALITASNEAAIGLPLKADPAEFVTVLNDLAER